MCWNLGVLVGVGASGFKFGTQPRRFDVIRSICGTINHNPQSPEHWTMSNDAKENIKQVMG